jgi:hypothetical protein
MASDLTRRRALELGAFDSTSIGGAGAARREGTRLENFAGSRRLPGKGRQSVEARSGYTRRAPQQLGGIGMARMPE